MRSFGDAGRKTYWFDRHWSEGSYSGQMSAILRITWDGNVPGLEARRLSLDAFGAAIRDLPQALQRIASDVERQLDGRADNKRPGALTREASKLDVQIVGIRANSPVTLEAVVVAKEPPALPLFVDLPDRAVEAFLGHLRLEAQATASHWRARKFLTTLPAGLSAQTYEHATDGHVVSRVELGAVEPLVESSTAAHLLEVEGDLVGLGFEDGRQEVVVRAGPADLLRLSATLEQVEGALQFRRSRVTVLAVAAPNSRPRLLRLVAVGNAPTAAAPDDRTSSILSRWHELLERLAQ